MDKETSIMHFSKCNFKLLITIFVVAYISLGINNPYSYLITNIIVYFSYNATNLIGSHNILLQRLIAGLCLFDETNALLKKISSDTGDVLKSKSTKDCL